MKRDYSDPLYKKWRLSIYKRDNWKCKWPGCSMNKKLNAHHIKTWADFPGLRYEVKNGITLCKFHHAIVTGNESYYEAVLLKLASENYGNS
jgi:predicted restriction endonuclease